jgi:Domain of unknown function (DUF4159)
VKHVAAALVLVLVLASAAAAQFGRGGFGGFGGFFGRYPLKFPTADTFGHGFVFCRGIYTSGRREAGGTGWSTDYPDAERNFSIRLSELTKTRVYRHPDGEPEYVTVRLTDEALFQCPYLHLEDIGTAAFTEEEVEGLRLYLLKGGFVWTDDYWGTAAWETWVSQIGRVLPPSEYPIQDIPLDHAILRTQFEVDEIPQIPSIQFWRSSGGGTSERGSDSPHPDFRGITDKHGNLIVVMTHNTDISDAWEREGEDPQFFYDFSPRGYALGINILLYSMTH